MQPVDLVFLGLLGLLLVAVTMVDLRERRIPNLVNVAIAALGLAHAVVRAPSWHSLLAELGVAVLSAVLFGATAWFMRRLSRHASIGMGDLKFLTAASLWVGCDGSVMILLVACVCAVVATLLAAPWQGLDMRRMLPFGPMLALAMVLVVAAAFHGAAVSDAHQQVSVDHAGTVSAASKPTNT
jgi:leader peptidase (prepilin peptidase)/N-methyltransferase